jgi:hypothetical protein
LIIIRLQISSSPIVQALSFSWLSLQFLKHIVFCFIARTYMISHAVFYDELTADWMSKKQKRHDLVGNGKKNMIVFLTLPPLFFFCLFVCLVFCAWTIS